MFATEVRHVVPGIRGGVPGRRATEGVKLRRGRASSTAQTRRRILFPDTGQEPVGVGIGDLDEAKEGVGGDRATSFVIVPGPEGKVERLGEEGSPMLSIQFRADLADSAGKVVLDGVPVGMLE